MRSLRQLRSIRKQTAFSLIELMVVVLIMILVAAFIAPAVTSLKSAGDVTSAAYTIKGVLEQARTYAMANNTYTWVGFYEEDAAQSSTNPPTPGNGRLVMSIVAAKDGVQGFDPNASASSTNRLDITRLIQVGKLIKLDSIHLPLFAIPTGAAGNTFDTRPAVQNDPGVGYNDSRFGELNSPPPNTAPVSNNGSTKFPFQYPVGNPAPAAQYTFSKTFQFSPRGEGRINSSYDVRRVVEIGLVGTHGNTVPAPASGAGTSTAVYNGNVIALQLGGFASNLKIYRR